MIINGKVFNPGEMRTQVTLHERSLTTGAGGFKKPSLSELATVWAKWTNAHGQEAWVADSVGAKSPATVLIRWRSDIDPTCVVEKGGVYFEIVSLDNIQERDEYIELKVQRWQPG